MLICVGCSEAPLEQACVAVRRGEFERLLSLRGRLAATETVHVRPAYWGKLAHVVPEGTRVEKGDMLFGLETEDMEERLEQKSMDLTVAQANFDKSAEEARLQVIKYGLSLREKSAALELAEMRHLEASDDLVRTRRQVEAEIRPRREIIAAERKLRESELALANAGIASKRLNEEIDSRKQTKVMERQIVAARLEKARTERAQTEEYLEKANTRAPQAGVVIHARKGDGQTYVVGEQVGSRNTIVELPDVSRLELEAQVNEVDIGAMRPGLSARVRVGALPGLVLPGRVKEAGAVAKEVHDAEGRATGVRVFDVVVELEHQDERLRPGMTARVDVVLERTEDVLLLPIDALRGTREQAWVLDEAGERHEIKVGSANDLEILVLDGLDEGLKVRWRGTEDDDRQAGSPES